MNKEYSPENLLKMAHTMQEKLNSAQQKLQDTIVEGQFSVDGKKIITVHIDGAHRVHHISLNEDNTFTSNAELLDAVTIAFNDGNTKIQDISKSNISNWPTIISKTSCK